VEAAVHIDVDLLHPLREALELRKETQSPLASEKKSLPRAGFGVSETAVGEDAYREALAAGRGRVEALHRRVRRGRHGRRRGEVAALTEAVATRGAGGSGTTSGSGGSRRGFRRGAEFCLRRRVLRERR
jgi:hypothetical protein